MNVGSIDDVKAHLESSGLPVAHVAFPPKGIPPLPFLVFLQDGEDVLFADGTRYETCPSWRVELYQRERDSAVELAVERCLPPWFSRDFAFLPDERVHEIIYTF